MMLWNIYRNGDSLRLRKLVVELWDGAELVDRRRMFSFPLWTLPARLERKKARMLRLATIIKYMKGE